MTNLNLPGFENNKEPEPRNNQFLQVEPNLLKTQGSLQIVRLQFRKFTQFTVYAIAVFLVCGIVAFPWIYFVSPLGPHSQEDKWPTTTGRITRSDIEKIGNFDRNDSEGNYVEFKYNVGPTTYESSQRWSNGRTWFDLAIGDQVKVYIDPDNPSIAVVQPGGLEEWKVDSLYPGVFLVGIAALVGIIFAASVLLLSCRRVCEIISNSNGSPKGH